MGSRKLDVMARYVVRRTKNMGPMDHCVDHITFKAEACIPVSNAAVTADKVARPPVKF